MKYLRYLLPSIFFLFPAVVWAAPTVNFSVFGGSFNGGEQTIEKNNISYALTLGAGNGGVSGSPGRRDSQWQFSGNNGAYFMLDSKNIGADITIVHRQNWVGVANNLCSANVASCTWVATWSQSNKTLSVITTGTATRKTTDPAVVLSNGAYNGGEQTIEANTIYAAMSIAGGNGGGSPSDYSSSRDSSYTFYATNGVYFTLVGVNIGSVIYIVHHKDWVGIYGPSASQVISIWNPNKNPFNGSVCGAPCENKNLGVHIPDIVTTITPLEPAVPAGSCTNYATNYPTCTVCDTGLTMSGGFCTDLSLVAPPTCGAVSGLSSSYGGCTYTLNASQTPLGGTANALVATPSGYTGSYPYICSFMGWVPNTTPGVNGGSTPTCTAPAPTVIVSISQDPVPIGGNPGFMINPSNTTGGTCYIQVYDGAALTYLTTDGVLGGSNIYLPPTSGTFYHGPFTTPGSLNSYHAYCYNSAGVGSGWTPTQYFTVTYPTTYTICPAGGYSNLDTITPSNQTRQLYLYKRANGTPVTCSDTVGATNITTSTTTAWTSADLSTATVNKGLVTAVSGGATSRSTTISVKDNGTSAGTVPVTVTSCYALTCGTIPTSVTDQHCPGASFSASNSCGGTLNNCTSGTRQCDFNWREVAP